MFYIHHTTCISPQQSIVAGEEGLLNEPVDKMYKAIEPDYSKIPAGLLRRMTKPMRMGVGAAMPLLNTWPNTDGIIIGTANAGMEDCLLFLKQIVEYEEGVLTPTHFVQSTPNAVAGQLGILNRNKGYNITHVHLGLAFENAVIDAAMLLDENPSHSYLLGATDDISSYNYNFNLLAGWYKEDAVSIKNFYNTATPGSIAGEGAAMFLVNGQKENAIAQLCGISTLHSNDENLVQEHLRNFLLQNLPAGEQPDLFLSGENGDSRLAKYYSACEALMDESTAIFRYKHFCGEYPTASAFACWLACHVLVENILPPHFIKKAGTTSSFKNILLYNNFKGSQHSFILLQGLAAGK